MFPEKFVWGVSTSAYQIEGAVKEDGRTESIWDMFVKKPGAIYGGDTGEVACDFYHRYKEDIALMKSLGIMACRVSVSWNRIMPEGVGKINQKGIDFYNSVFDEMLNNGIIPFVTLFHWDLPMCLYQKGGYQNREFADWFAEYARVIVENFSDRVKFFMTFNEPQCFIGAFINGKDHAPGLMMSDAEVIPMSHNVMLAHGKAVESMRKYGAADIKIGYAPQGLFFYPERETVKNIEAARRATMDKMPEKWYSSVSWWSDPVMLGKYPEEGLKLYGQYLPEGWEKDLEQMCRPLDFYGQNFYNGVMVDSEGMVVPPKPGAAKNSAGWDITPEGIHWAVKFLQDRYHTPIYITENGMCCHDWVSLDGNVHDPSRIDYMQRHLLELEKAIDEGIDVRGYFCWSILDNFEWTLGYRERFGLVYVDYENQKRIIKDSGFWYRNVILSNGVL